MTSTIPVGIGAGLGGLCAYADGDGGREPRQWDDSRERNDCEYSALLGIHVTSNPNCDPANPVDAVGFVAGWSRISRSVSIR